VVKNLSQINGGNLQNVRHETSRTFRNKKREYLRGRINELETNNKTENIRDLYRVINEFKKGFQPRINIIKNENGNLLADPQSVLNRWKNFFNQVLNVHGVHNFRQKDMQTAEPLVPEPSLVEVEKNWEYYWMVHQLYIDFKKADDSIKREVLHNISLEFGIPKKVVRLIKMYLNETYIKARVGKLLSDQFTIQNGLKQDDLWLLLFNFALEYAIS
jgi:hypothetical protein